MDEFANPIPPQISTPLPPKNKIIRTIRLFKNFWRNFSKKQKFRMIGVFTLAITLPLFILGLVIQKFDLREKAASNITNPLTPFIGEAKGPVNILFLGLNNPSHFESIINASIYDKLYTTPPFSQNKDFIAFYKLSLQVASISDYCNEGGAEGSGAVGCASNKIWDLIKSYYPNFAPEKFITAVIIESTYAGAAGAGVITIGSNPNISDNDAARNSSTVFRHEISHLFGLMDYNQGIVYFDGTPSNFFLMPPEQIRQSYNLDAPGCSKWCAGYKPVSEYNSACINFTDRNSCVTYDREARGDCLSGGTKCCVWSDTPFEYFHSKCVPSWGYQNIGISCLKETGCYFGGSYSNYVWRPTEISDTIMLTGDGNYDSVSQRQMNNAFKCCINPNFSSELSRDTNCATYKPEFENVLKKLGLDTIEIGSCNAAIPTLIPTPTITPTPKPGCGKICKSSVNCPSNLICYQPPMPTCAPGKSCAQVMPPKVCRNKLCPTKINCVCATPTPAPLRTPSPCDKACQINSDCPSGFTCYQNRCRSPYCSPTSSPILLTPSPYTPMPSSTAIPTTSY